jgi:flagellar protein FliS
MGGEIAADLDALYSFMTRELTRANLKNDRRALETVESLLTGLRETWVEAIEINHQESQPAVAEDSSTKHIAASF